MCDVSLLNVHVPLFITYYQWKMYFVLCRPSVIFVVVVDIKSTFMWITIITTIMTTTTTTTTTTGIITAVSTLTSHYATIVLELDTNCKDRICINIDSSKMQSMVYCVVPHDLWILLVTEPTYLKPIVET